ncbi:MAG: mediator complex subunit [Sclerophora amabilis]|nr:MAG: mediator complex subunit [Sclerophora amabilis]
MRYFYSASPGMSHTNLAASQLSHLEIVSFTPNLEAQEPSFPTLLAVYSNLPSPDDPGAEPASSSILMWELTSVPQKLHSSFDQLASRNNGTSSADQQTHYLKQREGITVSKTVLSIHPIHTNTVFIITYSDGSVEFRDRASLDIIFANDDFGTVSSMPQIGFAIPSDDHCLHLAVSPNFCLAVAMDSDGTPRLKTMQYTLGDPGDSNDDPKFAAVVTALTLQFVYSCAHHNNNDDLCATIRQFTNPNLEHEFLSEIYRAMTMSVDYSTETQHEKLFRNPMIQRCLSMQNALNYRGEDTHRTLNAKVAWLTLHLRLVALTFAFSFNTGPKANGDRGGSESEFTKPDVLHSILGIVRYYIDFTNFLMDELFELANLLKDQQLTIPLLQEHIRDTNSPALLILLSSIPRTLIRYNSRGIRVLRSALAKMFDPANPARMSANDPSLRPSLTTLITLVDRSPVRITDYERFISELDTQIKDAYNSSACAEPERRQAEKLLLISGTIPPPLLPAIKNILGPTLNAMRTGIDPAALYFADYSWLGVSDDKRTHDWARTHILDAIRKIELSEATQLRICTRCCATMEDVRPQKGSSVWMTSIQKMCLCGSLWMLFDASEKGRDDGLQRLNG